jgi:hypothetical protein
MMDEVRLFRLLMDKVVDLHIQKKNVENLFLFDNILRKINRKTRKFLFFISLRTL